jgi:CDP-glucose 4,6-dehydratase
VERWQGTVEDLVSVPSAGSVDRAFWKAKRVLVTGHTGFKGSWLATWLVDMGSDVVGYALEPPSEPSMFDALRLQGLVEHHTGDVRDPEALAAVVNRAAPEVVFHLAAQPLVREAHRDPVGTYATNIMGTVHLLQALRQCPSVRVVVIVTTDKVYDNREWVWGYREVDALGGHEPYSSSKASAELVVAAWRSTYFDREAPHQVVTLASARAGNVVGGGDWASDRLVPDAIRAFGVGRPVQLRNPRSTRPWQHVLEPLSGYLLLAQRGWQETRLGQAFNFGPPPSDEVSVGEVIERLTRCWGDGASWEDVSSGQSGAPRESGRLQLDWSKAHALLNWRPRTDLDWCLAQTARWYRQHLGGAGADQMRELTLEQIHGFEGRTTS